MTDDSPPIARQGTNDGLCGIYCLINAVRDDARVEDFSGEDLLRYLLEAATRLNNFAPSKIANGYEAHELVDIFNEFCRCLDLSWQALLLSTFSRSFPNLSPLITCKRVFEEEGKIILHEKARDHWLLAYGYDFDKKSYLVEDSSLPDEHVAIGPKDLRHFGVVILPGESLWARAHRQQ